MTVTRVCSQITSLLLVAAVLAGCAAAPGSPTPAASPSGVNSGPIGSLTVTHPASWHVMAGPPVVPARPVPLAYLANVGLSVGTCPTITPGGVAGPCTAPVRSLPDGGVLVTIAPNLGLAAMTPPRVSTISPPEAWCRRIGGEAEAWSVVSGTCITACLRGPGLAASEAQFQALVGSIRGELVFNRFGLARPTPWATPGSMRHRAHVAASAPSRQAPRSSGRYPPPMTDSPVPGRHSWWEETHLPIRQEVSSRTHRAKSGSADA